MKRKTKEIEIEIELSKEGEIDIDTGDKVLDHLLTSLIFYMGMKARISAEWDLAHHLWEDLAMVMGEELNQMIQGKNINRYGSTIMPMDDALVLVAVDISRSYLNFELEPVEKEGDFDITLVREFMNALSRTMNATIHIKQISGVNEHHVIEAAFKGLGVCLGDAIRESDRLKSTKGVL